MTPTQSTLLALQGAERVAFTITPNPSCRKGHWPCWSVRSAISFVSEQGNATRWEGPYEHLSMPQALDVVAVVSSHMSSALELVAQRELLEEIQLSMDLGE